MSFVTLMLFFKTSIDDELTAERERNKDDIEHLAAMERHFAERERAYEV